MFPYLEIQRSLLFPALNTSLYLIMTIFEIELGLDLVHDYRVEVTFINMG